MKRIVAMVTLVTFVLLAIAMYSAYAAPEPGKWEAGGGPAISQNSDLDNGWQAYVKYRWGDEMQYQAVYAHIDGLGLDETFRFGHGGGDFVSSSHCGPTLNLDYNAKADFLGVGREWRSGRLRAGIAIGAARSVQDAILTLSCGHEQYSESCSDTTTRFAFRPDLTYQLTDSGWKVVASYLGTGVKDTSNYSVMLGKSWATGN